LNGEVNSPRTRDSSANIATLAAAKAEEERKAAQEAQQAGSAGAGYQIIKNLAVEGKDYRQIIDTTIESCSTVCVGVAQCKMFGICKEACCPRQMVRVKIVKITT
jgi:hypothetical protein